MKKRILSIVLCLVLVVGLLPMTAGAAGSGNAPATIKIGGITLTDGKYLATNDATSASTYTAGDSYVALYKDGVLYLNGLNITKDSACVWWNYASNGNHNLVIELADGSVNTLVRPTEPASTVKMDGLPEVPALPFVVTVPLMLPALPTAFGFGRILRLRMA